jgi:hypothetical protein
MDADRLSPELLLPVHRLGAMEHPYLVQNLDLRVRSGKTGEFRG